ncbi:MAG: hypothetical protein JWM46_495 [Candidatus Kaiserbacteria bacterium]|nr:hypothetical protein [Candidatus Kaiserbacteria bacterium]
MPSLATAGIESARFQPFGPPIEALFPKMNIPEALRPEFSFLLKSEGCEGILALVATKYSLDSAEYKLIEKACAICTVWHGPRKRASGESERDHCMRCAIMLWVYRGVRNVNRIAAMILHDLAETFRAAWPIERIAREFNKLVARHVRRLTKPVRLPDETKPENERRFFRSLQSAPCETIEEKAMDFLDNLMTYWGRSVERMREKIRFVTKYFLPLMRKFVSLRKLAKTIRLFLEFIGHKLDNGVAFAY